MSDELQSQPVVDLELIFQPISEESPSGQDQKYSGLYDEMREARRADERLAQGEWQTELKVADFHKALNLGVDALSTKTKDLQIAAWLTEALVSVHGFAGFRDGIKILAGLQDRFWETMFPEIDEGDQESRANAIAWVDAQVALVVKKAPYTGVAGYGYLDWEDSKLFDFPEGLDSMVGPEQERLVKLKQQAERERRVTADIWRKEIEQTRRASVEAVNQAIEESWEACKDLTRVIEEKFERNQAPGFGVLTKALDDVHTQVKVLLEAKRLEEPDAIEEEDVAADSETGESGEAVAGGKGIAAGVINNRKDALKRLREIAEYFKKTEPHSPVSYLVQRAVKWGDMPLETWLHEVIKDQSVLFQLKETLGVSGDGQSDFN